MVNVGRSRDGDLVGNVGGHGPRPPHVPAGLRTDDGPTLLVARRARGSSGPREAILDVSDFIARRDTTFPDGDWLWLSIQRSGGDAADTYGGNVAVLNIAGTYTANNDGAHG